MANYSIEIQRNNVTLAQFLRYVRQQCEKKGIYMEIDREEFENPYRPESSSYTVIDGQKKCHFAGYRTVINHRHKIASYQTTQGFTRYYYTDELEAYEETQLYHNDWTEDGTDAPCRAETCRTFAYDFQTYILNHDGSMYNEIWNASGEKYREINLCAEYLDRPIFELAATLLHEMAHLYNLVHDINALRLCRKTVFKFA